MTNGGRKGGCENDINFSSGVFNFFVSGLLGPIENNLKNISTPPCFN